MAYLRWNGWVAAGTTAFLGTIGCPEVARADAVLDWHAIAANTICKASPPRPTPVFLLDQAVIQAAVYDAVQAIGGKYKPYHVQIPGASGSPEAAAAKASHDVLVNIFPAQAASLNTTYREYLARKGLKEDDPGVAVGEKAAAGIIALRADDGRVPNPLPSPFTGDKAVGLWRVTTSYQPPPPPSDAPMASSWLHGVKGFTLQGGNQFRADPPPALNSQQYAADYNEVKAVGAYSNSTRTPEQTELANFYHQNYLCVLFQSAVRDVGAAHGKNIGDNARLMVLANFAMADAAIVVWDSKRHYNFWRPVTAIHEGENDGNPATAGDPSWQPFLNNPPYSEYTSGANAVVGALTRSLALCFGKDDMTFTVTSDNPQAAQKTRTYSRFSDMASDMVNVRIYHGVHFRFANEAGRVQGTRVADWVFGHVAALK